MAARMSRKRTRSFRSAETEAWPGAAAGADPARHSGARECEFPHETADRITAADRRGLGERAGQPPSLCRRKVATSVPGPLRPAVRSCRECQ
jgi:hypothetical protein